jgi:ABC-type antimicrobial peptide transport system ATPase subunit
MSVSPNLTHEIRWFKSFRWSNERIANRLGVTVGTVKEALGTYPSRTKVAS